MVETLIRKEISELYYSMDGKRSLVKLRKILLSSKSPQNVPSLKTLQRWSKAFNWQARIEQRDIGNAKKIEAKVDKAIVNSKADYRTLINKVVKKFEEKLTAGKIRIDKPEDLSIMAKLDLLMMGEATEKKDVTYKLLDTDMSKYPKAKNGVSVPTKDDSSEKGD